MHTRTACSRARTKGLDFSVLGRVMCALISSVFLIRSSIGNLLAGGHDPEGVVSRSCAGASGDEDDDRSGESRRQSEEVPVSKSNKRSKIGDFGITSFWRI